MSLSRLSFPLAVALIATIGLTGCGQAPTTGVTPGARTGAVAVRSAVALKPGLEQAFAAAQAAARKAGGSSVGLVIVSGRGVGRDGRLLTDAELAAALPGEPASACFDFTFQRPKSLLKGPAREYWVKVEADGGLKWHEQAVTRTIRPWTFAPEKLMPLSKAIALAAADGLAGQPFDVQVAHGDALFFGAQNLPYNAPVTYLIGRTRTSFSEHRVITATSGLLHHQPDAAELAQVSRLLVPVVTRWHQQLTLGADRPANREDMLRLGAEPDAADFFIKWHDKDGDRQVSLSELVATHTTREWLHGWREMTIKSQFYRADANRDDRLTPAEAAGVTFEAFSFTGQAQRLPMPIDANAFAVADQNGDGSLDLNEYGPVGTTASLRLVELNPDAANSFFFHVQTKPWSH